MRRAAVENDAFRISDTLGKWPHPDEEQSATIFGLTAVLSSKQIYNINMQIQEDKAGSHGKPRRGRFPRRPFPGIR